MTLSIVYEKLGNIPVAPDAISFGEINANGINTFLATGNTLFAGSLAYDTITLNLRGIVTPPYSKPGLNPGQSSFIFRNRTWKILKIDEGPTIKVGNVTKFIDWSITGVDLDNPKITVS